MDNKRYQDEYRPQRSRSGWAIALIVIGLIFLLRNSGIISYPYMGLLFSWQMLLIGIGIWLLTREKQTAGTILIAIGAFFILPHIGNIFPELGINLHITSRHTWPIILIIVGVAILFNNRSRLSKRDDFQKQYDYEKRKHQRSSLNTPDVEDAEFTEAVNDDSKRENEYQQKEQTTQRRSNDFKNSYGYRSDFLKESIVFSSSSKYILTQNLLGGEVDVVFGQCIIDLRQANLKGNFAILDLDIVFGSVTIYAPDHWNIRINTETVLGSFTDKRFYVSKESKKVENRPELIISGNCVFSNGEIKS